MIQITEKAQEEFRRIMTQEGAHAKGIRMGVKGGGCSGFSYVMSFENEKKDGDVSLNEDHVPLFIDPKSYVYLQGLEIDFESDLLNRGFKFKNPNATKSCGCGTSFAV